MKLLLSILMMSSVALASAQDTYDNKCAKCHGSDGDGNGRAGRSLKTPPTPFNVLLKDDDAKLAKAIKEGGESVGMSKEMESYATLSDAEVKELVAFIRTLGK